MLMLKPKVSIQDEMISGKCNNDKYHLSTIILCN